MAKSADRYIIRRGRFAASLTNSEHDEMRVFLTGHGGWLPNNGFFQLPAKTRVVFYTENAKLMLSTDVFLIVAGKYPRQPDQVVEEFKSCQDMTLYPDDEKFVNP